MLDPRARPEEALVVGVGAAPGWGAGGFEFEDVDNGWIGVAALAPGRVGGWPYVEVADCVVVAGVEVLVGVGLYDVWGVIAVALGRDMGLSVWIGIADIIG